MASERRLLMQRTALVTGATRGIGLELARALAANGHDLVLASRNGAELEEIRRQIAEKAGVSVRSFPADLSRPGAPAELWREIERAGIRIDLLVNNAGSGLYGPLAEQDAGSLAAMLELNVVALTALTRLALPGML